MDMGMRSSGLQPIGLRSASRDYFTASRRHGVTASRRHGVTGRKRGDLVDVEPAHARRYFAAGLAQPAEVERLGEAYKPFMA
jgi:hypothetical protein